MRDMYVYQSFRSEAVFSNYSNRPPGFAQQSGKANRGINSNSQKNSTASSTHTQKTHKYTTPIHTPTWCPATSHAGLGSTAAARAEAAVRAASRQPSPTQLSRCSRSKSALKKRLSRRMRSASRISAANGGRSAHTSKLMSCDKKRHDLKVQRKHDNAAGKWHCDVGRNLAGVKG